jgi:hypothetical protein
MMRLVDTFLATACLVLLLILVNLFTPNLWIIVALLTMLSWPATAPPRWCAARCCRRAPGSSCGAGDGQQSALDHAPSPGVGA